MAGVQHQARAAEMLRHTAVLPQIAVLAVADDRMAKMRHVAPQLVLAAGFRLQLHQAVPRAVVAADGHRHLYLCQRPVVCHRRLRPLIGIGMFISDFVQLRRQRVVEGRPSCT